MYVVTNDSLARRQVRRGNIFLFAALGTFAAGFALATLRAEDELSSILTFGALLLGVFFWQVSLYYVRRWGPRERQDAALVKALKGLDNRYTLVVFSDARLPDYLLVGPLGVCILVARAIDGTIRGRGDQWSRGNRRGLLSLVLGNPVRNPTEEARQSVARVEEHLRRQTDAVDAESIPVGATIVFTHPRVQLEVESGDYPTTTARDLRAHVQRLKGSLGSAQIAALRRIFEPVDPRKAA